MAREEAATSWMREVGLVLPRTEDAAGDGLTLLTFPDGFRFYSHGSEEEAVLIYNEVFLKQEYLGVTLALDACRYVFDVGANVGIFSLFSALRTPGLVVHAFEPIPATYEVLVRNLALHGLHDVHAHNYALGSEDGATRALTYYPRLPGNTTAHPETKAELRRIMAGVLGADRTTYLFDHAHPQTVPVRTLSAVMEETGVPTVDLLKIDTEGDELAVLQGIADVHYPRIRQIALEVHDRAQVADVELLLSARGYAVTADTGVAYGAIVRAVRI